MNTPTHDPFTCAGCRAPMHIEDLAVLFAETPNTLYKWSRQGQPQFPRASKMPNGRLLVRCADALVWLDGRAR